MDILQLKYFSIIAKYENVSKAAEELMVAQPSLSKMIKSLEEELGVLLFDRQGKRIMLNENGKILKKYTEKILSLIDAVHVELADMQNHVNGIVHISMRAATRLLPEILLEFKKLYPDVKIVADKEMHGSDDYDIRIFSTAEPLENENTKLLFSEDCLIGVQSGGRYDGKKYIELKELEHEDFLILQNHQVLSEMTKDSCRRAGFIPNITVECDHQALICSLIASGMGVAFIPEKSWSVKLYPGIQLLKVNGQECRRYIHMTWKKDGYQSKAARLFREYLEQKLKL